MVNFVEQRSRNENVKKQGINSFQLIRLLKDFRKEPPLYSQLQVWVQQTNNILNVHTRCT